MSDSEVRFLATPDLRDSSRRFFASNFMYRDMKAWKDGRLLAKHIYEITTSFPIPERYGLAAQLRRAVVSIVSNIAEGQGRWSLRDQCKFYYIARGSLLETETQLMIAGDLAFVDAATVETTLQATAEVGRELNGLIRSAVKRLTRKKPNLRSDI